jgi:hypothetical protein
MVNRGIAPFDPTSPVGQFRVLYPDVSYVALDPAEPGYGDYAELSDAEIEALILGAKDSVYRAIGNYYAQLAGQAAKVSASIKDYDLTIDRTKRSTDLLNMAKYWWGLADDEDALSGVNEVFDVFSIVPSKCHCTPEAAARVVCGCRNVLF